MYSNYPGFLKSIKVDNVLVDGDRIKAYQAGDFAPMTVLGDRHEPRILTRFPSSCYVPYKHPAIDPWGHVYSCCYRVNPSQQFQDFNYGKFPETGLYEILHRAHDQGRIPRPQCAQCPDWELGYNQCIEDVLK